MSNLLIYPRLVFSYRIDPFTRKDWYDVKAPSIFKVRNVGKVIVNRTAGTSTWFLSLWVGRKCTKPTDCAELSSEGLKGRVIEVSLADLNKDDEQIHRKIKLRVDEVQVRCFLFSLAASSRTLVLTDSKTGQERPHQLPRP